MIFVALAVLFVVVLFISNNTTIFKNQSRADGLVYNGNEKVGDLINRDTDLDGVPDWQESLFGTDPTKKDTDDDGIPDNIEIARRNGEDLQNGELNLNVEGLENLTETDKFSRELFSTVATLNQAGSIDQATIDKLSESLVLNMQNFGNDRKVFLYSDLKIVKPDSVSAIQTYNTSLNNISNKYPVKYTALDVLQKFRIDENNVDESVLVELDPIIKQTNNTISDMAKMNVPESLALSHLGFLNALQKFSENLNNIKMYDADPIVAISAINQYEASTTELETSADKLTNTINQKLKQ